MAKSLGVNFVLFSHIPGLINRKQLAFRPICHAWYGNEGNCFYYFKEGYFVGILWLKI